MSQIELLYAPGNLIQTVIKSERLIEVTFHVGNPLRISLLEKSFIFQLVIVDRVNLTLVEPFNSLAIFPETKFDLTVLGDEIGAQTVLFTLVPVSLIAAPVCPGVNSEAMLLVVFVLAAVLTPVIPNVDAHTLHIIVQPFSLVFATV